MQPAASKQVRKPPKAKTKLSEIWGDEVLERGFTAIPNLLLDNYKALGMTATDLRVASQLLRYWWSLKNPPWPSKQTLADKLETTPSTIRKSIARMEGLGLVKREERRAATGGNQSNQYDLSGLVDAVRRLAHAQSETSA